METIGQGIIEAVRLIIAGLTVFLIFMRRGPLGSLQLLIYEMRTGLTTSVISGFGRAISEVGAVMIVGGNIKGKTRVMTTYISELKGMGNYNRAIAVGIILLVIAFIVTAALYHFQERESR